MITLKSKIKRRILSLITVASVFAFSASPVFAQENVSSAEESTSSEQEAIVITPEEISEKLELIKNIDPATVPETPWEVTSNDSSGEAIVTRAGNETWTGSGLAGNYTFEDYNLTPVKTMGKSGTLLIHGSFYGADGYADVSPIKLTVQIRSTSGAVKASTVRVDDRSGVTSFSVSASVSAGEQIQLYFDASSVANPPGIYRSAHVTYYYDLY